MMPVSTSPLPAVAKRRTAGGVQRHRAVGAGHHRARALEQHDRARPLGQRPGRGQAVAAHRRAHQPLVLAGVGGEDGGRAQRAAGVERREVAGQRVEAVGVEHERRSGLGHDRAHHELEIGIAGAAEARARPPPRRSGRRRRATSPRPRGEEAGRVRGQALGDHLATRGPARGVGAGQRAPHDPGARAHGRVAHEHRRAGHARRAADDQRAGLPLVGVGRAGRKPARTSVVVDQADLLVAATAESPSTRRCRCRRRSPRPRANARARTRGRACAPRT